MAIIFSSSGLKRWGSGCTLVFFGAAAFVGCSNPKRDLGDQPDAGQGGGGASAVSAGGRDADAGASGSADVPVAEGGGSATGGSAGAPPAVACTSSKECDDQLACNGVETCVKGSCVAGEPLCTNPDEAHCSVACIEGKTPTCSVSALDVDKDQHGTVLCKANPGDDCDDALATVYPGAPELCDGIDNDCNGKTDLDDGLTLKATTVDLVAAEYQTEDVAWLEEQKLYGFTWYEPDIANMSTMAKFAVYDAKGGVKVPPKVAAATILNGYQTHVAAGDGGFGIVWKDGTEVGFRFASADGTFNAAIESTTQGQMTSLWPEIAWSTQGNWALIADGVGVLTGSSGPISSAVTLVPAATTGQSHILGTGNGFVFSGIGVQPQVLSNTLKMPTALDTTLDTARILIGASADRFATVSFPVDKSAPALGELSSFSSAGKRLCGPVTVALDGYMVADVVATSRGYTVEMIAETLPLDIKLREVSVDCKVGTAINTQFFTPEGPFNKNGVTTHLTAGSQGYALTWASSELNRPLKASFFGPDFCN
jgi:hypothetical protein